MDAGPIPGMSDEAFLDAVSQDVPEPAGLGCLFLADQDGLVTAAPDGSPPVIQPVYLRDRLVLR
jgi:hypothetical protein